MGIVFEVSSLEEMCAMMCDNWFPKDAVSEAAMNDGQSDQPGQESVTIDAED